MSYLTQSILVTDGHLADRIIACAATIGIEDPNGWLTRQRLWQFSTQDGWVQKYRTALDNGIKSPGADETVITDTDILAAVQSLNTPTQ